MQLQLLYILATHIGVIIKIAKLTTTSRFVLAGGAFILIGGILSIMGLPSALALSNGSLAVKLMGAPDIYNGIIGVVSGVSLILSALFISMRTLDRIQMLSIIVLIFSIISLLDGGGFLVGFALAFAGALDAAFAYYISAGKKLQLLYQGNQRNSSRKVSTVKQRDFMPHLKTEEHTLYNMIMQANGSIFQAELVEKSGFSKVKVSRLLDRMEGLGVIERRRRGMTNIVILKEGVQGEAISVKQP